MSNNLEPTNSVATILGQDEAWEIVSSTEDPVMNQLLSRALTSVLTTYVEKKQSLYADFDLVFFVGAMQKLFGQPENLTRIIAGEDLRWFDDKE